MSLKKKAGVKLRILIKIAAGLIEMQICVEEKASAECAASSAPTGLIWLQAREKPLKDFSGLDDRCFKKIKKLNLQPAANRLRRFL